MRLERWQTPDSDFLRLHFLDGRPDAPTVLLLHGLEGDATSNYIRGTARACAQLGWNVIALEFRSCGGELNRSRRVYHSGETTDLDFVVRRLIDEDPDIRLLINGFSLGGNVTAKWLGELGDAVPHQVVAAAAVSLPFDLCISGPHLDEIVGGRYTRHFLSTLIPKALAKEAQYPGCIDTELVRTLRSFREFDTHVTAALHGFEDAEDYWRKASCGPALPLVRRPLLLLASHDDPFNPSHSIPHEVIDASPFLYPQLTEKGGHVGFVYGSPWRTRHWAEEQTVRFFEAILRQSSGAN